GADIALVDLRQRGIAAAAHAAVVAGPVGLRADRAIRVAFGAQDVQFAVVAEQLQVEQTLVEHEASQRAAVGKRYLAVFGCRAKTWRERAQLADKRTGV